MELEVDPTTETFRGVARVDLAEAGASVELDAAGLEVERVDDAGGPCAFTLDPGRQKLTVRPSRPGDISLRLEYRGRVRRDVMNGFYVSRFGDAKLLTTMMQPLGCRWLFPCLDHPAQKAVLRLTVVTDPDLTVIGNAAVDGVELLDGRRRWRFAPTPRMATYLVYLGIGPFDVATTSHDGLRVSVATAPGKAGQAARALALAGPIVRAYEEYYGLPYPLPKLDLIAVPDFWAGGMENWGAITFPEIGLLWGDGTSPTIVRWAVETLTHEIAHQWFGNLVTMHWWNDIWLNESFATFVAAKMEDRLHLRTDAWAEFLIRTAPGYFADSQRTTHPVKFDVRDPSEISQNVDDITYYKGANVVRMLEGFLGDERFRDGVARYLARFQGRNARESDLWEALEEVSDLPVRRVIGAWITRPGLPVVEVREGPGRLALSQRRFAFLPPATSEEPWPIPLTYEVDGVRRRLLFDRRTVEIPTDRPDEVRINPDRAAFLRVWFEPALRARRLARLPALAAFDRWMFLNDTFAFLLSGDATLADYLAGVHAARDVTDYPSVEEMLGSLRYLRPHLGDRADFHAAYLEVHRAQTERLTLESRTGEADTDPVLRETALAGRVLVDDAFAAPLADRFGEIETLPPAVRPAVAFAFARLHGPEALPALLAQARSVGSEGVAERAAFALGALPTEELLGEALRAVQDRGVRTVHVGYAVRSVAANPRGRAVAWTWLREHLREFEKKTEGSWWLAKLLQSTLPLVGPGREEEVRRFFESESFPEGSNGLRNGLEMLEVVGALRRRYPPEASHRGGRPGAPEGVRR